MARVEGRQAGHAAISWTLLPERSITGLWSLVSWFHSQLLIGLLIVVVVNQNADLACVAPLSDVLGGLTFQDLTDLLILEALLTELVNPLRQLVAIP